MEKRQIQLIIFALLISSNSYSQPNTIDYLGQAPPAQIPLKFAPDIVSVSNRYEYGFSVSPNGKEMFFTASDPGSGLMQLTKQGETWASPKVANLRKNNLWEYEAFYTYSGDTLYFTSDDAGKQQFFYATKMDSAWSEPIKLVSAVNNNNVMWCSFSSNGNMYYTNISDLSSYRSTKLNGVYQAGIKLNTGGHPYVSPDESFYLYNASGDIYIRFKRLVGGSWHTAIKLNSYINSTISETCPSLSPDGKYLFFSRYNDVGGKSDIYWVSTSFVDDCRRMNRAPYIYGSLSEKTILANQPFNLTLPDSVFNDDDGKQTLTYTATLSDNGPLPSWLTFFSDSRMFSGTPTETGTFSVKITATDTANISVSTTFTLRINPSTPISNQKKVQDIQVYPNPAKDQFTISLGSVAYTKASVEIYNLNGKMIKNSSIHDCTTHTIPISDIASGHYLLHVLVDGEWWNKRICVD